jgi:hypothetical protein
MRKLYRFDWSRGRNGSVTGVFVADQAEIEQAIGKQVCLGEVLGKHSNVQGTLENKDLTPLTGDLDFIEKAISYGLVPTGYNPLRYLRCPCGAMLAWDEHEEGCEAAEAARATDQR